MRRIIPPEPVLGDIRYREGFLLVPSTLRNDKGEKEWRWLEWAAWREEYVRSIQHGYRYSSWVADEWVVSNLFAKLCR